MIVIKSKEVGIGTKAKTDRKVEKMTRMIVP